MTMCHWVYDDTLASFIPGCMGGAVGGPDGCTCDTPLSKVEQACDARDEASEYVEWLRDKAQRRKMYIESLRRRNHRLYDEIRRLREKAGE